MSDSVIKIGASNEILGAILSANAELSELKAGVKDYIWGRYNVDLGDRDIVLAENDSSTVHLALPYYADLERLSAGVLMDDDTLDVVGAEVFASVTLAIILGGFTASLVAAGVATGVTEAASNK